MRIGLQKGTKLEKHLQRSKHGTEEKVTEGNRTT